MTEQPPKHRLNAMLEEFDWPEWERENSRKRVRLLQQILGATGTDNEKLLVVHERLGNFLYEDATVALLKELRGTDWRNIDQAVERRLLDECNMLFTELIMTGMLMYADVPEEPPSSSSRQSQQRGRHSDKKFLHHLFSMCFKAIKNSTETPLRFLLCAGRVSSVTHRINVVIVFVESFGN